MSTSDFDPARVNLSSPDVDPTAIICYLNGSRNEYNGKLGARISALFVILIISTAVTFFPVVAKRVPRLRIPLYVYLFARYFGAGVIIATAFIHLLDPAYSEIGPQTCVGMTGAWAKYSWAPGIVLTSLIVIFLIDLIAERYVEMKYGVDGGAVSPEALITNSRRQSDRRQREIAAHAPAHSHSDEERGNQQGRQEISKETSGAYETKILEDTEAERISYNQQIAAFLILEFGVIFHSVIIGLNLGVVGDEFNSLYPVLVFHQSFEGLGIGARMSAIPFPTGSWLPWLLCLAYGLTTPISIAIGLGARTTYNPASFTANVVSGVLDSTSAGILIYTGLVELLARDFLFDPERTKDNRRLSFMVVCVLLGTGIMALLGKWA